MGLIRILAATLCIYCLSTTSTSGQTEIKQPSQKTNQDSLRIVRLVDPIEAFLVSIDSTAKRILATQKETLEHADSLVEWLRPPLRVTPLDSEQFQDLVNLTLAVLGLLVGVFALGGDRTGVIFAAAMHITLLRFGRRRIQLWHATLTTAVAGLVLVFWEFVVLHFRHQLPREVHSSAVVIWFGLFGLTFPVLAWYLIKNFVEGRELYR